MDEQHAESTVREPGAVLLLSLAIAVAIRTFWVKILQVLIFLAITAVVYGVVSVVNLISASTR